MQKRQNLNIPIEIVRTVVAISETGSLSKAAERLGLSQPAVSSQIKRLHGLIGGSLFVKTANGTATTDLGKLALYHARRILDANDQLLRLGGNDGGPSALRLGLSTPFVGNFIKSQTAQTLAHVFIQADQSTSIGKGLIDGYIDVACIFDNHALDGEIEQSVIERCDYPLAWVRAKDFVLSPGAPIPILTWPGDDWMIRTLNKQGSSYKIVFSSPDYHAKLMAVKAGIGLTAIPDSMIPPDLVRAREYYLPELPPMRALLCARSGLEGERMQQLLSQLSAAFFGPKKTASIRN